MLQSKNKYVDSCAGELRPPVRSSTPLFMIFMVLRFLKIKFHGISSSFTHQSSSLKLLYLDLASDLQPLDGQFNSQNHKNHRKGC